MERRIDYTFCHRRPVRRGLGRLAVRGDLDNGTDTNSQYAALVAAGATDLMVRFRSLPGPAEIAAFVTAFTDAPECMPFCADRPLVATLNSWSADRKSTRLNSSHT